MSGPEPPVQTRFARSPNRSRTSTEHGEGRKAPPDREISAKKERTLEISRTAGAGEPQVLGGHVAGTGWHHGGSHARCIAPEPPACRGRFSFFMLGQESRLAACSPATVLASSEPVLSSSGGRGYPASEHDDSTMLGTLLIRACASGNHHPPKLDLFSLPCTRSTCQTRPAALSFVSWSECKAKAAPREPTLAAADCATWQATACEEADTR